MLPVCYYSGMKQSQLLNKQLNQEFDEAAYLMNRLVKGTKKLQKSVRLQKQAKKIYNEVING